MIILHIYLQYAICIDVAMAHRMCMQVDSFIQARCLMYRKVLKCSCWALLIEESACVVIIMITIRTAQVDILHTKDGSFGFLFKMLYLISSRISLEPARRSFHGIMSKVTSPKPNILATSESCCVRTRRFSRCRPGSLKFRILESV